MPFDQEVFSRYAVERMNSISEDLVELKTRIEAIERYINNQSMKERLHIELSQEQNDALVADAIERHASRILGG